MLRRLLNLPISWTWTIASILGSFALWALFRLAKSKGLATPDDIPLHVVELLAIAFVFGFLLFAGLLVYQQTKRLPMLPLYLGVAMCAVGVVSLVYWVISRDQGRKTAINSLGIECNQQLADAHRIEILLARYRYLQENVVELAPEYDAAEVGLHGLESALPAIRDQVDEYGERFGLTVTAAREMETRLIEAVRISSRTGMPVIEVSNLETDLRSAGPRIFNGASLTPSEREMRLKLVTHYIKQIRTVIEQLGAHRRKLKVDLQRVGNAVESDVRQLAPRLDITAGEDLAVINVPPPKCYSPQNE